MRKNIKTITAAALLAVSGSSFAWWGGPWDNSGWGDGLMDGDFGFSMHASGGGRGNAYGNNWYSPYYGPYAYGPYGAPYAYAPYGYAPYGYAPYGYGPHAAPYGMVAPEPRKEAMDAQRNAALDFQKRMDERRQAMFKAQEEAFERQVAMMRGPAEKDAKK